MSHTMKLWEVVIKQKLRKKTKVTNNQFDFMHRRSNKSDLFTTNYNLTIFDKSTKNALNFYLHREDVR